MPAKKPKLEMIQHERLGRRLRMLRAELFDVFVIIDDHYNAKLGMYEPAETALESINILMDRMAEQIIDDHPRETKEKLRSVYRKTGS